MRLTLQSARKFDWNGSPRQRGSIHRSGHIAAIKAIIERISAPSITSEIRGILDRRTKLLPNPSKDEWLLGAIVSSGAPEFYLFEWIAYPLGTFWHKDFSEWRAEIAINVRSVI